MKRFYTEVAIAAQAEGHALLLDGRPVMTPARARLLLPNATLADAIADEWRAQGDKIDPAAMPMTGFANAAIDQVSRDRDAFVRTIAAYAETDTLCYRADPDDALAQKQSELWDPLLEWAEKRYDISLIRVAGVIHRPQSAHSLSRLTAAVDALDSFNLATISTLVSIGGSLVAALAATEKSHDSDELWLAVNLEELWQEQLWGAEEEGVRMRQHRRIAFDDAVRFCQLVGAEA
ncbi:ATP12 family chaperone protein [Blastomonas sp.]|uniref:ATP12 family chaperone protein n=1 Tax=Blastomonas sp. TaxID=1909299 RepID=UPI0035936DF6